jgi:hypothetical protein
MESYTVENAMLRDLAADLAAALATADLTGKPNQFFGPKKRRHACAFWFLDRGKKRYPDATVGILTESSGSLSAIS